LRRPAAVEVRERGPGDDEWIAALLTERWGATEVVSRGRVHDASRLPALVAESDGEAVGLLTYREEGDGVEVVTIDSIRPSVGVGTALLARLRDDATSRGCRRIWLVTTNANIEALTFYLRRGFRLMAVHRGAVDVARVMKPSIPLVGDRGVELHDELELRLGLDGVPAIGESVELTRATGDEREIVRRLLQLYIHDFSSIRKFELTGEAHYPYRFLDAYFAESGRFAWLIRHGGRLAGLALVRQLDDGGFDMAEFFITRAHRDEAVGRRAAAAVLAEHPGDWTVQFDSNNDEAAGFWPAVAARAAAGPVDASVTDRDGGITKIVLRFTTAGRQP
jgi:predicted acetyltransferase/GNAT superfamily N-acetyltransferase